MTEIPDGPACHTFQPLSDPRWNGFLQRHPRASVFHTAEWLRALHNTYGYEPAGLTTSAPGSELRNALVYCRVKSWFSGRCLISLPFSDHCEPLSASEEETDSLLGALRRKLETSNAKYLEIRPITRSDPGRNWQQGDSFCLHLLDLRPGLDQIFAGFHKDCIQRKIRRAEREGLRYEEGTSDSQLSHFYRLLVSSRRRQQLPPQPRAWFRNLIASMGSSLKIRIAFKGARPVASILTLRHKDTLVYKYGCSDRQLNHLGGMPFLFWTAIKEAKTTGLLQLDLGRSDWDNPGLIAFKDRWGAARSVLEYRISGDIPARPATSRWQVQFARQVFGHMPHVMLPLAGSLVYKHLHRPPS